MNANQPNQNPNRERADQAICAALNDIQKMVVPAGATPALGRRLKQRIAQKLGYPA